MENKLSEKNWYVVNTYSGRERRVQENLLRRKESMNMEDLVSRVIVAEYEDIEEKPLKSGKIKTVTKIKNLYPGYVFIEMIMTDEAWYMVRNTPDVTGFVGSSGKGAKPFPVPREQMETVLKLTGNVEDSMVDKCQSNDRVKFIAGTFKDAEGTIIGIDKETKKFKVSIIFFGRGSEIDADVSEIEKI